MPDWFYRTVAQPVLFSLPDRVSRVVALGVIGTLGKNSFGRAIIDFMGHMAPDPRLALRVGGREFSTPMGLGWRVDPEQRATRGLCCFGIGCIEIRTGEVPRVLRQQGTLIDGPVNKPATTAYGVFPVPVFRRYIDPEGRECLRWSDTVSLPVLAWDVPPEIGDVRCAQGVVLQVGQEEMPARWRVWSTRPEGLVEIVRTWRKFLSVEAPLIVAGGIESPADAVAIVAAGASLVLVDAGLVFRGPALLKRCNDALLSRLKSEATVKSQTGIFRHSWFWSFVLGAAMLLGGGVTLGLAMTRVLLPYDEQYLGLTSETLRQSLPRLFAFMAHDRATLAGTMLGLGWLYLALAWSGVRCGREGAKTTMVASSLTGFGSFFAFFSFGYFDALHAFVAAVLFQITAQIMVGEGGGADLPKAEPDEEDCSWRLAQWGQLFWIIHAVGLLIAGAVILTIGMSSVFVSEDLSFLCMTGQEAQELGSKMVGVIAHDRATLGGMLLSSGMAMLLPSLWCFRRGAQWLWWAIFGLGLPAYACALGIHLWVGYTDWRHMVPALAGGAIWFGGMLCSRSYLIAPVQTADSS